MEEKVETLLASVGLNKNERKVYFDLLLHGKSGALEIATHTGIHRTNVYDSLRELEAKGFVFEVIEEHKRLFSAGDPEKIKDYILQIASDADSLIPQLKLMQRTDSEKESILMSKGLFALREDLTHILDLNEPIFVLGASNMVVESFGPGFLKEFHKKRISKKINMNHIYDEDALDRIAHLNKMKYTSAKYLPRIHDSVVSTVICFDVVMLIIVTEPIYVIKIKNKKIADSYRKYFDVLWSKSK